MYKENKTINAFIELFDEKNQEEILFNKKIYESLEKTFKEMTKIIAIIKKDNKTDFMLENKILNNCLIENVYQYQFRKTYFEQKKFLFKNDINKITIFENFENKYLNKIKFKIDLFDKNKNY